MKKYLFLIFALIFISCNNDKAIFIWGNSVKTNGYTIITDTIVITDHEAIRPLLHYNDKYYYSSFAKDSLGYYRFSHVGIIDPDGNIRKIKCSIDGAEFGRDDIFIHNDSVIIKSYYDPEAFFLDEKNEKSVSVKTVDDVVFEDDEYYVTSLDYGEWGSATWFKDKKTGVEYEAAGFLTPEILKFKGSYYLISPNEVNVIDDPKKLENIGKGNYKRFLGKNGIRVFYERSVRGYDKGIRNLYRGDITYERTDDFCFGPTFIHNGSIRFIVNDNNKEYIAKIENGKIIPVATIADSIYSTRYDNNYRNLYLNKTIAFAMKNKKLFGQLEVKDGKIYMHYFKVKPENN
ncbi:hypothetical protein GR160_08330 [Flavobacterium sp. Sd200]|uniref:hypothetical protein n=1 Tax=Flavobacterium sp. Sd200 TaxID=2692211 RepID=UPI00136B0273|nr:hypothetical protein [Flavobacterium sp. Sd200]MXN91234.1 hypothetical protein [Flavobacterium sp. Sd200]